MSALNFHHGIETVLVPDQAPPVRTVKSSVVGLIMTAGKGPVNQPVVLTSLRKSITTFGAYLNDGFTGPESFDGIYDNGSVSVVAINVCDPEVHNTDIEGEEVTLNTRTHLGKATKGYHLSLSVSGTAKVTKKFAANNTFTVPDYVTIESIKLGNTTFALTDDYTVAAANGVRTITRVGNGDIPAEASVVLEYTYGPGFDEDVDFTHDAEAGTITRPTTGSHILAGSTLTIDYTYVDPTKVEAEHVIGSQNNQTFTGIQALLSAAAKVKMKPRLLLAPRFTEEFSTETANAVITELNQVARVLGARVVCDAPQTDIDSAIVHGSFFTGENDRVYMHFPYDVVRDPEDANATVERPAAPSIAGLIAVVDNKEGFWNSPSNHERSGILGISRDLSFGAQDSETDVGRLNAAGISTTIFSDSAPTGGFRLWGNRQTNLQFLSVQRTADMITESIAVAHIWAVDRNINVGLLEQIVQSIKAYLRILEANGALVPNPSPDSEQFNDAWADPDLNTPDSVAEGNLFIDYRFNPAFPAEHIIFRAHITRKYITSIFLKA